MRSSERASARTRALNKAHNNFQLRSSRDPSRNCTRAYEGEETCEDLRDRESRDGDASEYTSFRSNKREMCRSTRTPHESVSPRSKEIRRATNEKRGGRDARSVRWAFTVRRKSKPRARPTTDVGEGNHACKNRTYIRPLSYRKREFAYGRLLASCSCIRI